MIEDKELGLKIAENPDEAFWVDLKKKAEKDIISNRREITINEAVIELAVKKIKENEEK